MTTWIELLWRKGSEGSTIDVLVCYADFLKEPIQVRGLGLLVKALHPIKLYQLDNFCVCDLSG